MVVQFASHWTVRAIPMHCWCLPLFDQLLFSSELGAAGNSSALAGIIARNVEKTVKLFNMKCEQAVSGPRFMVVVCMWPSTLGEGEMVTCHLPDSLSSPLSLSPSSIPLHHFILPLLLPSFSFLLLLSSLSFPPSFPLAPSPKIFTGKDAIQVSGPPNQAQTRNSAVVNALHAFNKLMDEVSSFI